MSNQDIIIIAVCLSTGGIVLLAGLAYGILKYRRSARGLAGWQDTRPRPFETPVYACTIPLPPHDASVPIPVLDISRNNSAVDFPPQSPQDARNPVRARRAVSPQEASDRLFAHSRPSRPSEPSDPRQIPSQSQQRSPGRTRTRARDEIRRYASEHPFPSSTPSHLPDEDHQTDNGRGALRPSRSANDLDRVTERSRYRGMTYPRPGPLSPSPLSPRPNHQRGALHNDHSIDHSKTPLVNEGSRHIQHYHSASPVVGPGRSTGTSRIQHNDAGPLPVNDPPPPYSSS